MANQQLGFEVVGKSNASEVMGKAGKEADKLANKLKNAFDIKGALTGAFIGAFGAAALLDKAINTITESFKEMGDIADMAGKAGISGAEFDKLSVAAKAAGISTSVLSKSIRELRFFMKDSLTDTSKMEQLTKNLGFAEADVRSGKVKSIDIFQRVAQAIATQENDTRKLAIATAFFGDKVANDMLPVLEAIGKNPDIFKGLVTASEEAYQKIDELDDKFAKLEHNMKRSLMIGTVAVANHVEERKNLFADLFSWILEHGPNAYVSEKMGIGNPFKDEASAPAQAQVSKANADAIADSSKKNIKNDNTIANSLGASMGNGPTSGVIGVGNNAQFTIMEQQLDALKSIKDSIDRLGPISPMNTDFTKESYQNIT